ncbi:hypothetical protein HPB52_023398 [Rhipicephalus sanguineus]|uniref:Uncharacterized protein n=1 Tax=Rhipicephalus sanguineus TaxID=34632 RepID=A0A9D4PDH8_RHISA|nr:hypothetical protein HPB52_023398 [Rhipicephalus sanguineus]
MFLERLDNFCLVSGTDEAKRLGNLLQDLAEWSTLKDLAMEADGLMRTAWRRRQYKSLPPPTNPTIMASANSFRQQPTSATATVGMTVQPSYIYDQFHRATTVPNLMQLLAHATGHSLAAAQPTSPLPALWKDQTSCPPMCHR